VIKTFIKVLKILSTTERWKRALLIGFMLARGAAEVVGIISFAPFLAVLADPTSIYSNPYLRTVYYGWGFSDPRKFLITLAVFFVAVLILVAASRTVAQYVESRYANMRRHSIAMQLIKGYVDQPYCFFLQHNTNELSKTILSEVHELTRQAIVPVLRLFSDGVAVLAVFVMLLMISPLVALTL
jgi:ABC-type bacteriocin/lantibiotic exporter with double-glycine peptidase domain